MIRTLALILAFLGFAMVSPAMAQTTDADAPAADTRAETGGAQTLEDILARQRGERVDDSFRRDATGDPDSAAGITGALGTLGGASDAEVFRALRYGTADVKVSGGGPEARVLIQDGGMRWLQWREGPVRDYGGYLLLGTLVLLALFYLIRGRIRISEGVSGVKILRFTSIERFGHWLLAGSFLLLAATGMLTLFGRMAIIPLLGKEAFAPLAEMSKWVHNNVAWAFIIALVIVFFFWVLHNLPSRHDITWFLKGGGIIGKAHPPAKKFNAGQKIIFWSVIILGGSIAVSGVSLLFPFELHLFAHTFEMLRGWGIDSLPGLGPIPAALSPHEEMQYAQIWHVIVSFVLMAIIIAHIYIGSLGMEGAYDAMGSGEVDLNWAKEHHSLWVEEVQAKKGLPETPPSDPPAEATPAE
ncbi:formate dehydrogenase subunit gamma [Halovulum sp. GXIMD14793]